MVVDRPSLEQARKRAKELLRQAHAGEPEALARLVRQDRPPQLADAQLRDRPGARILELACVGRSRRCGARRRAPPGWSTEAGRGP